MRSNLSPWQRRAVCRLSAVPALFARFLQRRLFPHLQQLHNRHGSALIHWRVTLTGLTGVSCFRRSDPPPLQSVVHRLLPTNSWLSLVPGVPRWSSSDTSWSNSVRK